MSYRTSAVILDAGDARLSYFVAGDGPPVTLLHGFTQSGRSWRELIAHMPEGWKWIVPDLRGHGETQLRHGALCSMDACTADLVRLWDALGAERSHIVGYSMGGRLALHVAARRPDRVLSLLTVGAHAGLEVDAREGRRRGDEGLAERIEKDGLEDRKSTRLNSSHITISYAVCCLKKKKKAIGLSYAAATTSISKPFLFSTSAAVARCMSTVTSRMPRSIIHSSSAKLL